MPANRPAQAARKDQAGTMQSRREPVPGIDGGNRQGQVGHLGRLEVFLQGFILPLRRPLFWQAGQALDPGQRSTFTRREVAGFLPHAQGLQACFGLTGLARIVGMQVDAVGAAVDLRSAQAYQLQQRVFKAAVSQRLLQADHGFVGLRRVFGPFDTVVHVSLQACGGGYGATVAPLIGHPDSQFCT